MCIELRYLNPNENGDIPQVQHSCGLLNILTKKYNTNKKVRINDTNIGTDKVDNNVNIDEMKQMVTLDFSLMGLTQPGKVQYNIGYKLKSSGKVFTCSNTFQIVYFPGWDNYVQYYYDATKTLINVKKEVERNDGMLVPGSYNYPLLSYEKLPDLIGPQAEPAQKDRKLHKSLVVTFAGENSMKEIDELINQFNTPNYKIILCVYDKSNWTSYKWIEDVLLIRVLRTMKWWFVKHFLHPDFVRAYDYVLLIDEDCNTKNLNPDLMLKDARNYGVKIGQPANGHGSYGSHNVVRLKGTQDISNSNVINDSNDIKPEDIPIGTWTTFVECGPFTFFSSEVWPCVWNMLQPDVTCGYGYDLMWANCAPNRTAVLHHHTMIHENRKPGSGNNKNFGTRCAAEGLFLFQRLAHINMTPFDPQEIRDFDEVEDRVVPSKEDINNNKSEQIEEPMETISINNNGEASATLFSDNVDVEDKLKFEAQTQNTQSFNEHILWIENQIKEKKLLMEKLEQDLIALNREKSILHDKL
eukprot:g9777.t1